MWELQQNILFLYSSSSGYDCHMHQWEFDDTGIIQIAYGKHDNYGYIIMCMLAIELAM